MNKQIKITTALVLSFTSMFSFASSHNGVAQNICIAKGGRYIQYSSESINIDLVKGGDDKLISFMYIKDPSPVVNGIVSLEKSNSDYKNIIIDAVNNKKSLSLCLNAEGDIFSATINGKD
ncbi:hypothetical protein [Photobacterium damselae]|uniref:hypothetical protein n=1 Tax=Photobacterium damselae TaxID=38293 RepID=UPI00406826CD